MAFDTSVKVENKSGTRLDVSVDTVVTEDTVNFINANYNVGSSAFITLESSLTSGTIVEILSFNLYSTDAGSAHTIEFELGSTVFYTFYIGQTTFQVLNVKTTVSGTQNFKFRVQESTAGTTNPSVSVVYRITPP